MFFDLHLHPALKSFLTDTEQERRDDCWTIYRNFIDFLVGNIIDSQASLRQLDQSGSQLSVAAIYVIEDGLDDIYLIRRILPLISYLRRGMIESVSPTNYWQRFQDKVVHLEASLNRGGSDDNTFEIASSGAAINPDKNTLVLAIEGAHILQATPEENPLLKLEELKSFRHKILYLTVCHFVKNPFCTHAFAMKLVDARKAPVFLPQGSGLTETGRQLIKRAYDDTSGQRILIDVKHFSASGRRDFYAFKANDDAISTLPIIASHVGVTGISWAPSARNQYTEKISLLESLGQYAVDYTKPAGLRLGRIESAFNPASINLYDEDIRAIIASRGLIGIMLDQRQLGVNNKVFEYFSQEDYLAWEAPENRQNTTDDKLVRLSPTEESAYCSKRKGEGIRDLIHVINPINGKSFRSLQEMVTGPRSKATVMRQTSVEDYVPRRLNRKRKTHLLHFVNNLLHVVKIGGSAAWDHVCIGSDYDGLVDAPNNCENVTEFPDLEAHLYQIITELIDQEGPAFARDHHIGDLREQIRKVMYENGKRFVTEWL